MAPFWATGTHRRNQRASCCDTLSAVERKAVVLAVHNSSDLPQTRLQMTEPCRNHTRLQTSTLASGAADNPSPAPAHADTKLAWCYNPSRSAAWPFWFWCRLNKQGLMCSLANFTGPDQTEAAESSPKSRLYPQLR